MSRPQARRDPRHRYRRFQPARRRRRRATLARLRALRGDLVEPAVAAHYGRIVKGTGDGAIVEFRSAVDAARCAIEVQNGLVERNPGVPPERRIEFRVSIHVGEVVEESDGDLMGDTVNIAARLEGIAKPGAILSQKTPIDRSRGALRWRSEISVPSGSRTSPSRCASIWPRSAGPPSC